MADRTHRSARRLATLVAVPVALLAGVLVFVALGGFGASRPLVAASTPRPQSTATVPMAAPTLPGQAGMVCRALLSRLPDALGDAPRRTVSAGAEQNAAYGTPAIALACGGAQLTAPAVPSTDPEEGFYVLSGVCWYAARDDTGSTWTTMDRETPVTVRVPAGYEAPAQRVISFSEAILGSMPTMPEISRNCR